MSKPLPALVTDREIGEALDRAEALVDAVATLTRRLAPEGVRVLLLHDNSSTRTDERASARIAMVHQGSIGG